MKRRYPMVCPSCGGLGWISNPLPVSSGSTVVCPACNGTKVVTVVEEDDD